MMRGGDFCCSLDRRLHLESKLKEATDKMTESEYHLSNTENFRSMTKERREYVKGYREPTVALQGKIGESHELVKRDENCLELNRESVKSSEQRGREQIG